MAISVCIPATPWPELLWRLELLLEALTLQTLAPTEVIVVDSVGQQPDDSVAQLVSKFDTRLPIRAYQMPVSHDGCEFRAGASRNYAVERLTVPVERYMFLDGDCVPDPDLLALHNSFGARHISVACARKHIDPAELAARTLKDVFQAQACRLDPRLNSTIAYATFFCAWGCVLSVPSELFLKIGGFWTRMIIEEDIDLGLRLSRVGGRVRFFNKPGATHIDHPYWRPRTKEEKETDVGDPLPKWTFTYAQAEQLTGYLREPL